MADKLTARGVESRAKRKGRYGDGDGLFLRVLDPGRRVYWTYRYTLGGKERETSIGPYPEMSLAAARTKLAELRAEIAGHAVGLMDWLRASNLSTNAIASQP